MPFLSLAAPPPSQLSEPDSAGAVWEPACNESQRGVSEGDPATDRSPGYPLVHQAHLVPASLTVFTEAIFVSEAIPLDSGQSMKSREDTVWSVRIMFPRGTDWGFDKTQLAEGVCWKAQPWGEEEEEEGPFK